MEQQYEVQKLSNWWLVWESIKGKYLRAKSTAFFSPPKRYENLGACIGVCWKTTIDYINQIMYSANNSVGIWGGFV